MPRRLRRGSFTKNEIISESELGSARYQWQVVSTLQQHPAAWMLCLGAQDYIALPAELLSEELKHFIARKVGESK